MTLEQAFFVQALAAYIQGKPDIRVPGGWESLDWPQLLQYARTQNLAGIFYVQCRDNLSRIPALQSILEELHAGFVSEAWGTCYAVKAGFSVAFFAWMCYNYRTNFLVLCEVTQ